MSDVATWGDASREDHVWPVELAAYASPGPCSRPALRRDRGRNALIHNVAIDPAEGEGDLWKDYDAEGAATDIIMKLETKKGGRSDPIDPFDPVDVAPGI